MIGCIWGNIFYFFVVNLPVGLQLEKAGYRVTYCNKVHTSSHMTAQSWERGLCSQNSVSCHVGMMFAMLYVLYLILHHKWSNVFLKKRWIVVSLSAEKLLLWTLGYSGNWKPELSSRWKACNNSECSKCTLLILSIYIQYGSMHHLGGVRFLFHSHVHNIGYVHV